MILKQILVGLGIVFLLNLSNNIIGTAFFKKENKAVNAIYGIFITSFFIYFSFFATIILKSSFTTFTILVLSCYIITILFSLFRLKKLGLLNLKTLWNINLVDLLFLGFSYFLMVTSLSTANLFQSSDGYYYSTTVEVLKSVEVFSLKTGIISIVSGDIVRILNIFLYFHAFLAKLFNVDGLIFVNRIFPMIASYYLIISLKAIKKSYLFNLTAITLMVVCCYSINEYKTILNTPALGSAYGCVLIAAFIFSQKEKDFSIVTLFILNVFAIYLSSLLFAFTFLFTFILICRKLFKNDKQRLLIMIGLIVLGIFSINIFKEITKENNNIFLSIFQGSYLLNSPYIIGILSPVTILIFLALYNLYPKLKIENYLKEVFIIASLPFINAYVTAFLEPNYFIGIRSWSIIVMILIFYFAKSITEYIEKHYDLVFMEIISSIILAITIIFFSLLPINIHIYESLELKSEGTDYFQATMTSRSVKILGEDNGLHPLLNDLKADLDHLGNSCFIDTEYLNNNMLFYLPTIFEIETKYFTGARNDCTFHKEVNAKLNFNYAISQSKESAEIFFKENLAHEVYYNEKWDITLYIYKLK